MDEIVLQGSVLGGKADEYTEQEKQWISVIATRLRNREDKHRVGPVQRQDMTVYVRAAGSIYELAKAMWKIAQYSRIPGTADRTADDWLRAVTGIDFNFMGKGETYDAPARPSNEWAGKEDKQLGSDERLDQSGEGPAVTIECRCLPEKPSVGGGEGSDGPQDRGPDDGESPPGPRQDDTTSGDVPEKL